MGGVVVIVCVKCGQQFLDDDTLYCFLSLEGKRVFVCQPCVEARDVEE